MLFLGLYLVGLVCYNLLLRRIASVQQVNAWVIAALMQTGIAVPLLLVLPWVPIDLGKFDSASILVTTIVVLLSVVLLFASAKALSLLEVSTYSIIYNLRIVIATFLAAILWCIQP